MKRIILSLAMIAFVGAAAVGATGAFFSDSETSTGNTFAAGSIDLKVDSVSHINGLVCFNGTWHPESTVMWNGTANVVTGVDIPTAVTAYNVANPSNVPQAGTACTTTWGQTTPGVDITGEKFFNFTDLKPGDNGENTISLHVLNNDARACVIFDQMQNNDNGLTEPEDVLDDTAGAGEGELAQELNVFTWGDDGDNIWEDGELPLFASPYYGPASDVLGGVAYDIGTLPALQTKYIGMYWCYGAIGISGNTLSCNGAPVTNMSQSDSLTGNMWFYIEQARNNPGFACPTPNL